MNRRVELSIVFHCFRYLYADHLHQEAKVGSFDEFSGSALQYDYVSGSSSRSSSNEGRPPKLAPSLCPADINKSQAIISNSSN